jgi:hypothetical protein
LKHTTLANLVASRICHDLINPIGATHNGIELLALDPNVPKGLEFDLITASLNDAKARVEFCRLVFGAAAADMTVTSATFRSLMSNIFDQKRYGMTWGLPDTIDRGWACLCCASNNKCRVGPIYQYPPIRSLLKHHMHAIFYPNGTMEKCPSQSHITGT